MCSYKNVIVVAIVLFSFIPALVLADAGNPDTLALEIHPPPVGHFNMPLTVELFCYNDADSLSGVSVGFRWQSDWLHLDSVKNNADAWDFVDLYDEGLETDNLNNRLIYAGVAVDSKNRLPAAPIRQKLATYYFTMSKWMPGDQVLFDTSEYNDGAAMLLAYSKGVTIQPVWAGGDNPIIITAGDVYPGTAHHVSVNGSDIFGDGSENYPLQSLRKAFDLSRDMDTIWVHRGIYSGPKNRDLHFGSRDLKVLSTDGTESTIIDAEGQSLIFFIESDSLPNRSQISGFTLRNGFATIDAGGGAIRSFGAEPTITFCVFENCQANYGAAIYINGGVGGPGDPTLPRLTAKVSNCTFVRNQAIMGPAIYYQYNSQRVEIDRCIFFDNVAERGAPVDIDNNHTGDAVASLAATDIYGNTPGDWIGAIGAQLPMNANFSADPQFCDYDQGLYRIQTTSPCAPENNQFGRLVGALGVGCAVGSGQRVWVVAPDGDDVSGNGTPNHPFQTISRGIQQTSFYDTVLVMPGTYHESLNYGGKLIVVRSAEGPQATNITNERTVDLVIFDHGENNRAVLEGFTLQGGWMGVLCVGSGPTIRRNILVGQNTWNWAAIGLIGTLEVVDDPTGDPHYTGEPGPAPAVIINNTIVHAANGGISSFSTVPPVIKNNIIAFNETYGFHQQKFYSQVPQLLSYNNVYGHVSNYINIVDPGPGSISADPVFTRCYGLAPGSPCIDAGDPDAQFNDPDGTRNDMGAVPSGGRDIVIPTNEWISVLCSSGIIFHSPLTVIPSGPIRAYDPDGVLCGIGEVTLDGFIPMFPIYRDDIYTDIDEGAEPGDVIRFTLMHDVEVTSQPEVIWSGNGDVIEVCDFTPVYCSEIVLHGGGWELVSWNVAYVDDIKNLFKPGDECLDVVLSFEEGGLTYDPMLPEFSSLQTVDYEHGYWVRVTCSFFTPVHIPICGQSIPANRSIQMEAGWNLVSYWPPAIISVEVALRSILDNLIVATGFEFGVKTWMPGLDNFNTLTELKPGLGYWAKTETDARLIYPDFGYGDSVSVVTGGQQWNAKGSLPTDQTSRTWVSAYGKDITLDGQLLKAGDLIEFYSERGALCGRTIYGDGLLRFTPIYGIDEASANSKQYPAQGDKIKVVVNGERVLPDLDWTEPFSRIQLSNLVTESQAGIPASYQLGQNYPNPFNPQTTIRFSLPEAGKVKLTVLNVLGQQVATLIDSDFPSGAHETVWYGKDDSGRQVASGIYLYRLETKGYTSTKKMILTK